MATVFGSHSLARVRRGRGPRAFQNLAGGGRQITRRQRATDEPRRLESGWRELRQQRRQFRQWWRTSGDANF